VVDTRAEIERRGPECVADPRCADVVARDLRADKLVQTRLATLGGTVLVRIGLVDVSTGTRDEERQEVVNAATAARVDAALAGIARGLGRPYAPPPRVPEPESKWYQQWWVWTLVGTAIVGTGVGVGAAVLGGEPGPDVVITPP